MVAKYGNKISLKGVENSDLRMTIQDLLIRDQFQNRAMHQSRMVGNYETILQTSVNASIIKNENEIMYNDDDIHHYGGSPVQERISTFSRQSTFEK